MRSILVSVIVPILNMDRYLDRFLAEFSLQTMFSNTEFILDLNKPSVEALRIVEKYNTQYKDQ